MLFKGKRRQKPHELSAVVQMVRLEPGSTVVVKSCHVLPKAEKAHIRSAIAKAIDDPTIGIIILDKGLDLCIVKPSKASEYIDTIDGGIDSDALKGMDEL